MARKSLGSLAMSPKRTGIGEALRRRLWVQAETVFDRLLNSCVYGQLFSDATDSDMETLRTMGQRWKQYEKEGKWRYEGERNCTSFIYMLT